jgi:hypothetical protein
LEQPPANFALIAYPQINLRAWKKICAKWLGKHFLRFLGHALKNFSRLAGNDAFHAHSAWYIGKPQVQHYVRIPNLSWLAALSAPDSAIASHIFIFVTRT